jgi:hypothetical protein
LAGTIVENEEENEATEGEGGTSVEFGFFGTGCNLTLLEAFGTVMTGRTMFMRYFLAS